MASRRYLIHLLVVAALAAVSACAAADDAPVTRPNIVFLLADDLGYGDLGCCGHPYARTPNLDRLAAQGTRFQQFYVTGITCCPSRTGFMTGKLPATFATYPANGGFGDRVTVTQLLKQAGYATGHFGKWHIGPQTQPGTYGIDAIQEIGGPKRDARGRDAEIYDQAIAFIEQHHDRPFYVNVWGHITHHAVNPPKDYFERFRDVKFKETDFPQVMHAKFATARQRGSDAGDCMRRYLGDVASLDDSIGRLLKRLDDLGLSDNTIVVFSSDHGSPAIPPIDRENKKRKRRNTNELPANRSELAVNLMGFNGGLRGGKHNMYEGGVRVPLIIRWPGHVPAGRVDKGSVTSGIDWLPTLTKITGISIDPSQFDGEDVSAAWLGKAAHVRQKPLLWKTSNPNSERAIRQGQWKLHVPGRRGGGIELYDLASDATEQTNVAGQQPQVVQSLRAIVDAWDKTLPRDYIKSSDREE